MKRNAPALLFLLCYLLSPQHARPAPAPSWSAACCRVATPGGAAGSGSLVSAPAVGGGLVVTNQHVVGRQTTATLRWSDGTTARGRVVFTDRAADLALIELAAPAHIQPLQIASKAEMPRAGDAVSLAGYGTARRLTIWPARVQGYAKDKTGRDSIIVRTNAESGDSGGPIIFQGRVVGVLWGGRGHYAAGRRFVMTDVRGTCGNWLFGRFPRIAPGAT